MRLTPFTISPWQVYSSGHALWPESAQSTWHARVGSVPVAVHTSEYFPHSPSAGPSPPRAGRRSIWPGGDPQPSRVRAVRASNVSGAHGLGDVTCLLALKPQRYSSTAAHAPCACRDDRTGEVQAAFHAPIPHLSTASCA